MPTESDRDDLAQMFFAAIVHLNWQTWEQTSDDIRAWCRAKADDAMAAGWRRPLTRSEIVNNLGYSEKDRNRPDRIATSLIIAGLAVEDAALADPAGATGGE
jgi:hypothetical protein